MCVPSPPLVALPPAALMVMTVDEVRASMGLGAVPKGVWVTQIGGRREWQPTEPPVPSGARCTYCHVLADAGSHCTSCGAPL